MVNTTKISLYKLFLIIFVFIIIVGNISVGVYYFSKANKKESEIPHLLSEEVYELKTEYIQKLKRIKELYQQYEQDNQTSTYVQISYEYNELNVISDKINSHMKLNSSEYNFYIHIPSKEDIKSNDIEKLLEYSFNS